MCWILRYSKLTLLQLFTLYNDFKTAQPFCFDAPMIWVGFPRILARCMFPYCILKCFSTGNCSMITNMLREECPMDLTRLPHPFCFNIHLFLFRLGRGNLSFSVSSLL